MIGPSLVIFTKDLWQPFLFAATFAAQAVVAALAGIALTQLKLPPPMTREQIGRGRPLGEIVRNPKFVVAVFVGVWSYTLMNLVVMTSAPLAMVSYADIRSPTRPSAFNGTCSACMRRASSPAA